MLIIAFADHILRFYIRQFFKRLVPTDHLTFIINNPGGIRQKVNNLCQALLRVFDFFLGLFPFGDILFDCDKMGYFTFIVFNR
jgi:hypothetical protein